MYSFETFAYQITSEHLNMCLLTCCKKTINVHEICHFVIKLSYYDYKTCGKLCEISATERSDLQIIKISGKMICYVCLFGKSREI